MKFYHFVKPKYAAFLAKNSPDAHSSPDFRFTVIRIHPI
jgi:hypothetical protein